MQHGYLNVVTQGQLNIDAAERFANKGN